MTSLFSWQNSISLCPASFHTPRPNLPVTPGVSYIKEYVKAVYCHPTYLTYMQSTSRETLGWKKHKLESRLPGEISITSDMR